MKEAPRTKLIRLFSYVLHVCGFYSECCMKSSAESGFYMIQCYAAWQCYMRQGCVAWSWWKTNRSWWQAGQPLWPLVLMALPWGSSMSPLMSCLTGGSPALFLLSDVVNV